jgi:hypothetical protein
MVPCGFAARREDELLHFGTAVEWWGSGLATWLHDQLLATYAEDVRRIWLRVFAATGPDPKQQETATSGRCPRRVDVVRRRFVAG